MDEAVEYDHLKILRAIVGLLRRRGLYTLPRLWEEHVSEVFWKRSGKNKPVEHKEDVEFEKELASLDKEEDDKKE